LHVDRSWWGRFGAGRVFAALDGYYTQTPFF
jgi:hypothetical protein